MTRGQRVHRGFHRLGLWLAIASVVYLAAIFGIGIAVVNPFYAPWVWVIGAAIYAALAGSRQPCSSGTHGARPLVKLFTQPIKA
jgi:hypothetical protein